MNRELRVKHPPGRAATARAFFAGVRSGRCQRRRALMTGRPVALESGGECVRADREPVDRFRVVAGCPDEVVQRRWVVIREWNAARTPVPRASTAEGARTARGPCGARRSMIEGGRNSFAPAPCRACRNRSGGGQSQGRGTPWCDAAVDQPGHPVPRARDVPPVRPRGRARHPRSVDARWQSRSRVRAPTVDRATAIGAAAALAPRGGSAAARLPVLGGRSRLRPGIPRPRDRSAGAGQREPARRSSGSDHRSSARSHASAVGAVPDPRSRGRTRRGVDQDPPRGRGRPIRRRDHGSTARPVP